MPRLAPGTRVGPYRVVSFIAAGGMGEVYRCHDDRLDRSVAIKILPETSFDDREAVLRFEREARAAAAVLHPNLISIHDVGCEGDAHYLVMDLLEGQTLRERLGSGPLPWVKAVELAIAVADGLAEVHARGFVHRDLKPANIFITLSGWVKVLDFGLAIGAYAREELSENDSTVAALTGKGTVMGTTAYMSPEQLRGDSLDARSDIFALGTVLYELLTGVPLFARETKVDTIAAILNCGEITMPPSVPNDLAQIVRRSVEQDRDRRFQSAADLAFALRLAGTSRVAAAPPVTSSIAVLPFANLSGDKDNDYFSDGLAEEILNTLTRIPGLKVAARTSAFAFRGKHEDARRIGEALGVRTILEGGVRRDVSRVRVTAQLIDAATGYHLWSDRYDRAMTDVFAVQDEIAAAIAATLHVKLIAANRTSPHTPNIDAYHAFLRSRHQFGRLTPERLRLSQTYAEEAIALDPEYAAPYAQLAECLLQSAVYGAALGTEVIPRAKATALKAVALDESEPSAHMTLARIAGEHDLDWTEALRRCRLALACERVTPVIRALCAQFILWPLGLIDELTEAIEPALADDRLSPMPRFVRAQGLVARRRYDRALEELATVVEIHPSFWPGHLSRGAIYTATDDSREAIAALDHALAIAPWNTVLAGLLAGHALRENDRTRADELLARFADHSSPAMLALGRSTFHYVSRDFERAAEEYERVIATRYPVATYYLTWLCVSEAFRASAAGQRLRKLSGV